MNRKICFIIGLLLVLSFNSAMCEEPPRFIPVTGSAIDPQNLPDPITGEQRKPSVNTEVIGPKFPVATEQNPQSLDIRKMEPATPEDTEQKTPSLDSKNIESRVSEPTEQKKISLDFKNLDIHEVLKIISVLAGGYV